MLGVSIILGLIGVVCILDSRILGRLNMERPLFTCTLGGQYRVTVRCVRDTAPAL